MRQNRRDPLEELVLAIESYCNKAGIDHRFVGGVSYGGLLNEKTRARIDIPARTITLAKHNTLSIARDDRSLRDVDLIYLTTDKKKIAAFKKQIALIKKNMEGKIGEMPSISFEGTLPLRESIPTGFLQFVTVIETKGSKYFLRFDNIRQNIAPESLEPWSVVLENGMRYTTRNPIADYYAYQFRSPSGVKPKDMEKIIFLKKLSDQLIEKGKTYDIDYNSKKYYKSWMSYTNHLKRNWTFPIASKKIITNWYWSTVGTDLAHGKGPVNKHILSFFNLVTRLRQ